MGLSNGPSISRPKIGYIVTFKDGTKVSVLATDATEAKTLALAKHCGTIDLVE